MPGDTAGTSSAAGGAAAVGGGSSTVTPGGNAVPTLNLAGVQIPYSLISLVTLTVQNSALTILLHYSRTAPNSKPYSAAAAVLLNEILKGSISSAIALSNIDSSTANVSSAAFARYNGDTSSTSAGGAGVGGAGITPGSSHEKRASVSHRKRNESLGFGQEEAWHKRNGLGVARPPQRAWWLDIRQCLFRLHKLRSLVFSADCWKLGVPACCYVLQNNLQFVAATNLDVATFQVSYQMKILTTAFFSVTMLRKRISMQKWLCLLGLAAGVAVVQLQGTEATGGGASGHADMDRFTGFVAVVMACMTSGFAGVYFEKVLKGANADLWVRNIQLTLFSLPPALLAALFPDLSIRVMVSGNGNVHQIKIVDPDAPTWLFGNFGFWALATVFCQVFGGLVTALVIRYSDNIAKGFATSLSIILSFVAGIILFNFKVTTPFIVGCSMVLAATWFYNQPEGEPTSRIRQGTYRPVNTVPPDSRNGHGLGHVRDQSHSYAVEISSSPGMRRHTQVSDAGSVGEDPAYPYANYPNPAAQPPKFVNVSPFVGVQAVPSTPPYLQEESVSPKSPVPPFLEGSPFGGGPSTASKES